MALDRLFDAIRQVYDSATDAALWPACLTSIGRLLGGTSTNLLYHDLRSKGGIQLAIGADPELYRLWREYGHAIDPWALAFPPGRHPPGNVVIGASVVDPACVKRTEFYAAMGRRYECCRVIIGVLEASRHRTAVFSVNRGDRHEEFDSREARVVSILLPHLRRALAIQRRLGVLDNERAAILEAIDQAALGIVLVDHRARPILVNGYAARLLRDSDGLSIENGSLTAAARAAASHLRRALGSAIAVANGNAVEIDDAEFVIPRSAGRRPLYASVCPFGQRQWSGELPKRAAAGLFLVDPELTVRPLNDRLQALYSLTAAEARVAGAVAAGRSAPDIAERFGVSRETARSQIKRVFEKADVRSQSAFIRLVATDSLRVIQPRQE